MCEYLMAKEDENSLLKCSVTGDLCTLCILGNANCYNSAKESEKANEKQNNN